MFESIRKESKLEKIMSIYSEKIGEDRKEKWVKERKKEESIGEILQGNKRRSGLAYNSSLMRYRRELLPKNKLLQEYIKEKVSTRGIDVNANYMENATANRRFNYRGAIRGVKDYSLLKRVYVDNMLPKLSTQQNISDVYHLGRNTLGNLRTRPSSSVQKYNIDFKTPKTANTANTTFYDKIWDFKPITRARKNKNITLFGGRAGRGIYNNTNATNTIHKIIVAEGGVKTKTGCSTPHSSSFFV